jgi:hypothetical protein
MLRGGQDQLGSDVLVEEVGDVEFRDIFVTDVDVAAERAPATDRSADSLGSTPMTRPRTIHGLSSAAATPAMVVQVALARSAAQKRRFMSFPP